jgi:hypothetical protein
MKANGEWRYISTIHDLLATIFTFITKSSNLAQPESIYPKGEGSLQNGKQLA